MLQDLIGAYRHLFVSRSGRVQVAALIAAMAAIPVTEMLAIRLFTQLITQAPSPDAVGWGALSVQIGLFLVAFGTARGAHHLVKVVRVRVFRDRFDDAGTARTPSEESWEWAMAFELSGVLVSLVQAVAFSALFLALDLVVGGVNAVVGVVVVAAIAALYRRQARLQADYAGMGHRAGSTPVSRRVGSRVVSAEVGSVVASVGMVAVLVSVLLRTVQGHVPAADAIVLFLALRIMYGQLGLLSSAVMRFARAAARRGLTWR